MSHLTFLVLLESEEAVLQTRHVLGSGQLNQEIAELFIEVGLEVTGTGVRLVLFLIGRSYCY